MAKSVQGLQELLQQVSSGVLKEAATQSVASQQQQPKVSQELLDAQKVQNIGQAEKSVQSQIANTSAQMQEVGIDPQKYGDTRNPIEKLLNLKPKQNWLFDIFETLQRPQQALFRGINAFQTGQSDVMGEAFKGLTGQGDIMFGGQLLRNMGAGDNIVTDVAGFALDVFADPADLAFIPAAPIMEGAKSFSKAASKIDNLYDASKAAVQGISKFEKVESNLSYIQKGISTIKDSLSTAKVSNLVYSDVSKLKKIRKNLNAASVATVGDKVKDTVARAADSIKEGMKVIPEASKESYITKLGKNFQLVKDAEEFVSPTDLVMRSLWGTAKTGLGISDEVVNMAAKTFGVGNHYADIKKYIGTTFSPNKAYTAIISNVKKVFGEEEVFDKVARASLTQIDDSIVKYAEENAMDVDALQRLLSVDYVKSRAKKPFRTVSHILNSELVFPYTEEAYDKLQKALILQPGQNIKDVLPVVTYKIDGKESNWISLRTGGINKNMIATGSKANAARIQIPNLLSKEDMLELDSFRKMKNYQQFSKQVYDNLDELYKKSASMLGSEVGLDGDMSGYLRNVINENARIQKFVDHLDSTGKSVGYRPRDMFIGDPKTFKTKKYPATSVEANLWATADAMDAQLAVNQQYIIEHMNINAGSNVVNDALKNVGFPADKDLKYQVVGLVNDIVGEDTDVYLRMLNQNMQTKVQGKVIPLEKYKMFSWANADGIVRQGTKLSEIMPPEDFNKLVDYATANPEQAKKLFGDDGIKQLSKKLKIKEPVEVMQATKSSLASPIVNPETVTPKVSKEVENAATAYEKAAKDAKNNLRKVSGVENSQDLKALNKAIYKGEITDPTIVKAYEDWQSAITARDAFKKQAQTELVQAEPTISKGAQKVKDKYQQNVNSIKAEIRKTTGIQGNKAFSQLRRDVKKGLIKDQATVDLVNKLEKSIQLRDANTALGKTDLVTKAPVETAFENANKYVEPAPTEGVVLGVKKETPITVKNKKTPKSMRMAMEDTATLSEKLTVAQEKEFGVARDIVKQSEDNLETIKGQLLNKKFKDYIQEGDFKTYDAPVKDGMLLKIPSTELSPVGTIERQFEDLNNKYIRELEKRNKLLKEYGVKSIDELPEVAKEELVAQVEQAVTQNPEFSAIKQPIKKVEKSPELVALESNRNELTTKIGALKDDLLAKSPLAKGQSFTEKLAEIKSSTNAALKSQADEIKALASERSGISKQIATLKPQKAPKEFIEKSPKKISTMKSKKLEKYIRAEIKDTAQTATKINDSLSNIESEIEKMVSGTVEFDQAGGNIKRFLNSIDRDLATPELKQVLNQYDDLKNFELNLRMRNAAESVQQTTRRKTGEFGSRRKVFAKERKFSTAEEMITPDKRKYEILKKNIDTRTAEMATRIGVKDQNEVTRLMDMFTKGNLDAQNLSKIRQYKNLEKQFKGTLKGTSKYGQIADELKTIKTELIRSLKVKNTTDLNAIINSLPDKIDKFLYKDMTKLADDVEIFNKIEQPQSVMPELVKRFSSNAERTINNPFKYGMESSDAALLLNAKRYETDLAGKVFDSKVSYGDLFRDRKAITMEEALVLADGNEQVATQYFNVFKRNSEGALETYLPKSELNKNLDLYRQTGKISPSKVENIGMADIPANRKLLDDLSNLKKKIRDEINVRRNAGVVVPDVQENVGMTGAIKGFLEQTYKKDIFDEELSQILLSNEYKDSAKIDALVKEYNKLSGDLADIVGVQRKLSKENLDLFDNLTLGYERSGKFGELTPAGKAELARRQLASKRVERYLTQLTPEEKHITTLFEDVAGSVKGFENKLDYHTKKYNYIKRVFKDLQFDEYLRLADDIAKNPNDVEKLVSDFTSLKYINPEKTHDYVAYLNQRTTTGAKIVGDLNESLTKGVKPQDLISAAKKGTPIRVLEAKKAGTLSRVAKKGKLLGAPKEMATTTIAKNIAPMTAQEVAQGTVKAPVENLDQFVKRLSSTEFDRTTSFADLPAKTITPDEFADLQTRLLESGVKEKQVARLTEENVNSLIKEVQKGLFKDIETMQNNSIDYLNGFKNKKLFEESMSKQIGDWIGVFGKEVKNARVYQETFQQLTKSSFGETIDLNDENGLIRWVADRPREIEKGDVFHKFLEPAQTPIGYVSLKNTKALVSKIEFANELVNDPTLAKVAKQITEMADKTGGRLVIEANTARLLTLDYKRGANELTKIANIANDLFKRNKLLSPAFNVRNVVGVTTNMWLSGMTVREIGRFFGEADTVFKQADELISMRAALSEVDWSLFLQKNPEKAKAWNALETYMRGQFKLPKSFKKVMQEGLEGTGSQMQDIESFIKPIAGKTDPVSLSMLNKASLANGWGNETIDAYGRMAVLLKALDGEAGQAYMKNLNIDNDAIEAVRLSMFDPKNLTVNEMEVVKKFIPFYTFTKMNLAYHMKNIPNNAVRYHRMYKAITSMWDMAGINVNDVDNYKLEQMYVPLPGINENGKYYAIKANFPQSDVAEFVSNPLGKGLAMVTPLVRAPFEYATGTSIFTGNKLENFAGERSSSLPFLTKKSEYLLSQTGLDVPLRVGYGAVKAFTGDTVEGLGQITNLTSQGNIYSTRISKQYEALDNLQAGVSQLKQQGVILPEITVQSKQNMNPKLQQVNVALDALMKLNRAK